MALMMRGGVLVLLAEVFGLAPMAAHHSGHCGDRRGQLSGFGILTFLHPRASGVVPRVRWHLAAIGLFLYVLVLRLLYMGHGRAHFRNEMYYWVYSQKLDLWLP